MVCFTQQVNFFGFLLAFVTKELSVRNAGLWCLCEKATLGPHWPQFPQGKNRLFPLNGTSTFKVLVLTCAATRGVCVLAWL